MRSPSDCWEWKARRSERGYGAFYHKDNSDYNGGVLGKQFGTWAPTLTGSATLHRPYDSFLTIGGTATATNSTASRPASTRCWSGSAN